MEEEEQVRRWSKEGCPHLTPLQAMNHREIPEKHRLVEDIHVRFVLGAPVSTIPNTHLGRRHSKVSMKRTVGWL